MFIEQAMATDLARLDAETQRLRDQRAEIDNQVAKNEEDAYPIRSYFALKRKYEKAISQQETAGSASTTASTSDTAADGKTLSRRTTDLAVDLIRAKKQPIHTRDLLPEMKRCGLNVGGKNPVANLSGYLCRDKKRLVNNRRLGWRLVEWGGDTPPNDRPK